MDKQEECWFLNSKKVIKQQMLSKSSHQIINGVSITLEASFGCLQNPIRRNCLFVNDDTLMFISGKHIVLYDIIRKRQTYIMKSAEDEIVQALNFSVYNHNLLIALAFKSTNKILPTVKVYNRSKKRFYQLVHSHLLTNSSVFEMQFLNNGKNLVTLSTSEEGCGLSLFSISKEVSLSYTLIKAKINILEIMSELELLVIGPTFLSCYKYQLDVNGLEFFAQYYNQEMYETDETIIDCAFGQDQRVIIVATSLNNILLLKGDALLDKYKIDDIQNQTSITSSSILDKKSKKEMAKDEAKIPLKVSSIAKTQKGFIIGLMGKPALQVFEIEVSANLNQHQKIHLIGTYSIKDEHIYGIHQVHLASDDMYAALTVVCLNKSTFQMSQNQHTETIQQQQQALSCEQILDNHSGKLELFTFNLAIVEALRTVQKDPFEPLFEKGVHKGTIFNVGTTPMRSLIASVCEDKSIKFWDYSNDFKELFSHQFHESPLSVALHPLSFQCAIGFKDGMRFYFILDEDLKLVHTETTKACNAMCYSEGGHILAASNFNLINLFDPQTYTVIQVIQNHQTNIKDLQFVDKDSYLISQCAFGVLYVQNLITGERLVEHAQKQNKYHTLYYDHHYDLVVGVSDQRMKVYNEKGSNLALEIDTSPTQFSAICVSLHFNAIFFGTTQGSVRIYAYPFYHFNPKTMEFIEIPIHQLAITQIKLSPDNSYLITSSVDGSIFFSKIKQYINGQEVSQLDLIARGEVESKLANTFALNNLCVVSSSIQEMKQDQIKELEYRLQNFKSDIDDAKEVLLNRNEDMLQEQNLINNKQKGMNLEAMSQTMQASDYNISKLKQDTMELRKQSKQIINDLDEQQSQKLLQLYKVRDELGEKFILVKKQQEKLRQNVQNEYQQTISQVDEEYLTKYQDLYQRFSDAMNNMKLDQRKFKEVLQQGERDYETYYHESQLKLQNKLQKHNQRTEDIRSSISKLTKENERLMHRQEFLQNLITDTTEQVQNLQKELLTYREKHRKMNEDLREKEKLINQREQQIKDFRMKNVHLQNFQKVYDYRVNTLKEEREPLMDHLKNMEKHVKNLYNELIEESGLKQQRMQEEDKITTDIKIIRQQLFSAENVLSFSLRKIENCRFQITQLQKQDVSKWQKGFELIYQQLMNENSKGIKIKNTVFQETLKDMQKDPIQQQIDQSQQNAIFKELSSQKYFLKKKLQDVETAVNYQLDERQEAYYTIQSTNADLIKQCTALREKKQRLKEYIDKQNKAYREIKRELTSQGVEVNEEDPQKQFMATHATAFSQQTRTPATQGAQSQQQFRKKIIRNL